MTTKSRIRTTIELNPGDKAKLRQIARQFGIVWNRGNRKGQGSISALMQAIAKGEIIVQKTERNEK